jgi:hypothetical protein
MNWSYERMYVRLSPTVLFAIPMCYLISNKLCGDQYQFCPNTHECPVRQYCESGIKPELRKVEVFENA